MVLRGRLQVVPGGSDAWIIPKSEKPRFKCFFSCMPGALPQLSSGQGVGSAALKGVGCTEPSASFVRSDFVAVGIFD